ncbi:MAG: ABC transporter ATP-binding protein [Lentimicrobiaceae bacterium]|nr:ABC transporter ATP-binding protein [Lentimicrobiaceae bacterium]
MKAGTGHKPYFSRKAWRYFMQYYDGLHGRLLMAAVLSSLQVLLIVPVLFLVRHAFDVVIPEGNTRFLVYIGLGIFLLRILQGLAALWVRRMNVNLINKAIWRLRRGLLERLYQLSVDFYTHEDHRILHARIVQDSERLTHLSNALVSRIFPAVIISLALCIVLLFLNAYILLIILSVSPVLFLANRVMGRYIRDRVVGFQRVFERFSKGVLFVLRYMDLTRIQSAQHIEIDKQSEVLEELRHRTGSMTMIYAVNAQVQEVITGISGILIIILGGAAVIKGSMTLGDFLSFYLAAVYLNKNIQTITSAFPDVLAGNESMVTLQRLSEEALEEPYQGNHSLHFKGQLRLDKVVFGYEQKVVLNAVDLVIQPGTRTAIIGPNGAGKTTLIQLILGAYKPWSGTIHADGFPYEALDMTQLRQGMGVVMQHPLLFSGSIRDNITYGSPDVSQSDIEQALQVARADSFIHGLPQGIDSQIGEEGVMLSGGERQRIAIARALVRKPSLLILDEPTNHIDGADIGRIVEGLSSLPFQPAVLLISHDTQVIRLADRVYSIENQILKEMSHSGHTTIPKEER